MTPTLATLRQHFTNACDERRVTRVDWPEAYARFVLDSQQIMTLADWNIPINVAECLQSVANIADQTIAASVHVDSPEWSLYSYAVGMHELGHCMAGVNELDAWQWALENVLAWTVEMDHTIKAGLLGGYYLFGSEQVLGSAKLAALLDLSESMVGQTFEDRAA